MNSVIKYINLLVVANSPDFMQITSNYKEDFVDLIQIVTDNDIATCTSIETIVDARQIAEFMFGYYPMSTDCSEMFTVKITVMLTETVSISVIEKYIYVLVLAENASLASLYSGDGLWFARCERGTSIWESGNILELKFTCQCTLNCITQVVVQDTTINLEICDISII